MAPRLQPLPAMVRCLAIVAALGGVARADRFEPPASVPAAQDRYLHGKSLFAAKQFTEAANEFAAAYQLDSDAKFLLFDIALAHRMAGRCDDAIAAYRAFVDAHPPEQYLAAAKIGIDRCEHAPPPVPEPTPPVSPPPPAPIAAPPAAVTTPVTVASPWYRDGIGDGLTIGGAAAGIMAGVLYTLARGAASDTFTATSLPEYHDRRDAALAEQTASWIAASAGAMLVVAGAIRYAVRPSHTIAVAPTAGGAVLGLGGRF